jgi:aspartyl-tRNA(Asn)/glutamyl-tRNA(Gln) amidotransferase subunit C
MKKIDFEEIKHIAKLANLTLSQEEIKLFSIQLSETLVHIAELDKLPTEKILPTFQTAGLVNIFRNDEIKPSLSQNQALSNSKSVYKGYFKTKPIFF